MSKLEEVFKEKLTDYSIPPGPDAWERVEARLSKKNKTIVWLRWAAVFLLAGLLMGILWLQNEKTTVPLSKVNPPQPLKKETDNKKPTIPTIARENSETQLPIRQEKQKKKNVIQPHQDNPVVNEAEKKEEVAELTLKTSSQTEVVVKEAEKETIAKSRPIVLTYVLEPVETPAQQGTESTTTDKKEKSLQRMVEFAKNIKHSESPLGNLRDFKGDIFALDLKKKPAVNKENNE